MVEAIFASLFPHQGGILIPYLHIYYDAMMHAYDWPAVNTCLFNGNLVSISST